MRRKRYLRFAGQTRCAQHTSQFSCNGSIHKSLNILLRVRSYGLGIFWAALILSYEYFSALRSLHVLDPAGESEQVVESTRSIWRSFDSARIEDEEVTKSARHLRKGSPSPGKSQGGRRCKDLEVFRQIDRGSEVVAIGTHILIKLGSTF